MTRAFVPVGIRCAWQVTSQCVEPILHALKLYTLGHSGLVDSKRNAADPGLLGAVDGGSSMATSSKSWLKLDLGVSFFDLASLRHLSGVLGNADGPYLPAFQASSE